MWFFSLELKNLASVRILFYYKYYWILLLFSFGQIIVHVDEYPNGCSFFLNVFSYILFYKLNLFKRE